MATIAVTTDGKLKVVEDSSEEEQFKHKFREAFRIYFAGVFRVSGEGPLINLWPEISYYLSTLGMIVVVEKGKIGELVLAKVADDDKGIERDLTGKITKIKVQYFDEKQTKETNSRKYVLFLNDIRGQRDLANSEWALDLLWKAWDAINDDLKRSKARWIIKSPIDIPADKLKLIRASFDSDMLVAGSFGDGIEITFDKWEPRSNQSDLWATFYHTLSLYKIVNGIRHVSDKKEVRNTASEAGMLIDQFQYMEGAKKQVRLKALAEAISVFGKGNYTLVHE